MRHHRWHGVNHGRVLVNALVVDDVQVIVVHRRTDRHRHSGHHGDEPARTTCVHHLQAMITPVGNQHIAADVIIANERLVKLSRRLGADATVRSPSLVRARELVNLVLAPRAAANRVANTQRDGEASLLDWHTDGAQFHPLAASLVARHAEHVDLVRLALRRVRLVAKAAHVGERSLGNDQQSAGACTQQHGHAGIFLS